MMRINSTLTALDLSGTVSGQPDLSPNFTQPLAGSFKMNSALTELNLSSNQLNVEALKRFAEGIKDNYMIAKLDISDNYICGVFSKVRGALCVPTYDASGLHELAHAIANLKELNVSMNLIQVKGAQVLAPAIHNMEKLKICSYWLPIQELKTAKELDLSGLDLAAEDAVIVSSCVRQVNIKFSMLPQT